MKNENSALIFDNYNPRLNDSFELKNENNDKKINIKLFFTKTLVDIINGAMFTLTPYRKRKIDLKNTCLFLANDAVHLVKIIRRSDHDNILFNYRHRHYVDIINGNEYCSLLSIYCVKTVHRKYNFEYGIFDSPINYMSKEELEKLNSDNISYEEKLEIVYLILQRANEKYQEQRRENNKIK